MKIAGHCWDVACYWEPRDAWIGLYWNKPSAGRLDLYICLVPFLPLRIRRWEQTS